jgi:3-oxoacyl-[acyl-carrier-protein] synthase-1
MRPDSSAGRGFAITAYTITSAVGSGCAAHVKAIERGQSGLRRGRFDGAVLETWLGRVEDIEHEPLPPGFERYDCRNNRLAALALGQDGFEEAVRRAARRYGDHRVAVILGTSTSGIRETERAYSQRGEGTLPATPENYRYRHNLFSLPDFVRSYLGLRGIAVSISTACSSSAKTFASAKRSISAGLCDAAVVGGVDTVCFTTLFGFRSLELLAQSPCRPWAADRDGISLGEAGGFALIERDAQSIIVLEGCGESSDAHHMSAPHPQGLGAELSMRRALSQAGCEAEQIDYVNLHGTGTPANDRSEDLAVCRVLGTRVPCSATKGLTGHTLGAAGMVEAAFCMLALQHELLPGTTNTPARDPALEVNLFLEPRRRKISRALTNSFGFGGSNCSLVFARS